MLISFNWLKEFVKLPAKISADEVARALTSHTVEVERVINQADSFRQIVVGKVLTADPHPRADRLRVLKVDVKTEVLEIVCGAPNVASGQFVAVALVGAILPGGLEIKPAEIRGLKSYGMVCSEDELGLGENKDGIMVLTGRPKLGESLAKHLSAEDFVLEIDNKSLSNRPDLLSHYGLARELSVIFDVPLKDYQSFLFNGPYPDLDKGYPEIKIADKNLCPRYQALKINKVRVQDSPTWLRERLVAAGQRPINNIVDLSNFVMLELGQPMHVFDGDKIKKIIVRTAQAGESLNTLDGERRNLSKDDLVIAEEDRLLALAGIMGGQDSGVSSDTKNLLLESANFAPNGIRRTSQSLNLRTESSGRFEKSLDPALTELALRRFAFLLKKICPEAEVAGPILDLGAYQADPIVIDLNLIWLNDKLGVEVPRAKTLKIFDRLGFKVLKKDKNTISLEVPSWRASRDIKAKEDLAEEILRFYGYDLVPSQWPASRLEVPDLNRSRALARRVKNFWSFKHALAEVYNYSFLSEEYLHKLQIDFSKHLRLANPLSELYVLLRRNLAPGLIANIKNNQAKTQELRFFELGSVFYDLPGQVKKNPEGETLPHQEQRLGLVLAGNQENLFPLAKGLVDDLMKHLFGFKQETKFMSVSEPIAWADEMLSAKIMLLGQELGTVAQVSPSVSANLNLKKKTVVAELNFDRLLEIYNAAPSVRWQEAPKYPAVNRDLAIVVSQKVLYNDIKEAILNFSPLIATVELFDIYQGDKLGAALKSLAFHIIFQASDRTLTAQDVEKLEQDLMSNLQSKFSAQLRNF